MPFTSCHQRCAALKEFFRFHSVQREQQKAVESLQSGRIPAPVSVSGNYLTLMRWRNFVSYKSNIRHTHVLSHDDFSCIRSDGACPAETSSDWGRQELWSKLLIKSSIKTRAVFFFCISHWSQLSIAGKWGCLLLVLPDFALIMDGKSNMVTAVALRGRLRVCICEGVSSRSSRKTGGTYTQTRARIHKKTWALCLSLPN